MKKLAFINGSLLFALLEGGQIVASKDDGYDYHVIVLNHNAKDDAPRFTAHQTNNYAHKNAEFGIRTTIAEKDRAKVIRLFDEFVKQNTEFKELYPKEENKPQQEG